MNRLILSTTALGLGCLPLVAFAASPQSEPVRVTLTPQAPVAPAVTVAPVASVPAVAQVAPLAPVAPVAPVNVQTASPAIVEVALEALERTASSDEEGVILDVTPVASAAGNLALVLSESTVVEDETEALRNRVNELEAKLDALLKAQSVPTAERRVRLVDPRAGAVADPKARKRAIGLWTTEPPHDHDDDAAEAHENVIEWITDGECPEAQGNVRVWTHGGGRVLFDRTEAECEHADLPECEDGDDEGCEGGNSQKHVRRFISVGDGDIEELHLGLESLDGAHFDMSELESALAEMDVDFGSMEFDLEDMDFALADIDFDLEDIGLDFEDCDLEEILEQHSHGDGPGIFKVRVGTTKPQTRTIVKRLPGQNGIPHTVRKRIVTRPGATHEAPIPTVGSLFGARVAPHASHEVPSAHQEFGDLLKEMHNELRELRGVIGDLSKELKSLSASRNRQGSMR